MTAEFAQELQERRALANEGVWVGKKPPMKFLDDTNAIGLIGRAIIVSAIVWVVVFVLEWIFQPHLSDNKADNRAETVALLIFFGYLLMPYLRISWISIKNKKWAGFYSWQFFSRTQKTVANVVLAYLLMMGVSMVYTLIAPSSTTIQAKNFNDILALSFWGITSVFLYYITNHLQKNATSTTINKQILSKKKSANSPIPFGLWLGESTGTLSNLSHGAGMAAKQHVALFKDDAAQNILILGAIGAGKTTRAINPLLLQLLDQKCGGLIFDIKGDFYKTVDNLSKKINVPYTTIGVSQRPLNLLAGLTPEIASSFLKSALLLNSGQKQDGFWIDTATELCRNVLGILTIIPAHYSLHGLYNFLFDSGWRNDYYEELETLKTSLSDKELRLLKSYQRYYETIFADFDDKVQAGVKATISQVLSPFNHPELIDTFCTANTNSINLEDALNGQVFLIDMPLSRWGLGAKVVYTFIKLRFFNLMQSRVSHPEWDQNRFVFFMCDEYQEIISANKDGLSDLNFWDKSRSSKTIGIISTQSISSFYAAIGDRDIANALLQNFRQKICFRTEDDTTISLMNRLLGMVEVQRLTQSQNSGNSSGQHSSSHSGEGSSISTHEKPLLDGQFFRTLPRDHALVLLSLWGNGCDDVLKMDAVFS